jgi:hypothetical protein
MKTAAVAGKAGISHEVYSGTTPTSPVLINQTTSLFTFFAKISYIQDLFTKIGFLVRAGWDLNLQPSGDIPQYPPLFCCVRNLKPFF